MKQDSVRKVSNQEYSFWYSKNGRSFPIPQNQIEHMKIIPKEQSFQFEYRSKQGNYLINNGPGASSKLGAIGGYTHELGRYWSIRLFNEHPELLRVYAQRFAYIIVDEAQDIGLMHQSLLELLISVGTQVSLIGDPLQAIYEFSGADGRFMKSHSLGKETNNFNLSHNFRSIPEIVKVSNQITLNDNKSIRVKLNECHGVYYVQYAPSELYSIIELFKKKIIQFQLAQDNSVVLCRGKTLIEKIQVGKPELGVGKVKLFALAAIKRDVDLEFNESFKLVIKGFIGLLKNPPINLAEKILNPSRFPEFKILRKYIWMFIRDTEKGLPPVNLKGKSEWHPKLVKKVQALLDEIKKEYKYEFIDNLGNVLSKKNYLTEI